MLFKNVCPGDSRPFTLCSTPSLASRYWLSFWRPSIWWLIYWWSPCSSHLLKDISVDVTCWDLLLIGSSITVAWLYVQDPNLNSSDVVESFTCLKHVCGILVFIIGFLRLEWLCISFLCDPGAFLLSGSVLTSLFPCFSHHGSKCFFIWRYFGCVNNHFDENIDFIF